MGGHLAGEQAKVHHSGEQLTRLEIPPVEAKAECIQIPSTSQGNGRTSNSGFMRLEISTPSPTGNEQAH
jgi:hypothetical protein